MIDGIILGVLTWASLLLSWWHFPQPIKNATKKHVVLTDLVASTIAFLFLSNISKSLVAVIGAIVAGLLVNFTIITAQNIWSDNERT